MPPVEKPVEGKTRLEIETDAIVEQFKYSDDDVNKGVREFLRQMGMYYTRAPTLGL
jgi:hypothetical protein